MTDVEQPMGNAELRLTLQNIEEKVDESVKQSTKTNGSVAKALIDIENLKRWRTGLTYAWMAFVLLVVPILGFTLLKVWDTPQLTPYQIKESAEQGTTQAFETMQIKTP